MSKTLVRRAHALQIEGIVRQRVGTAHASFSCVFEAVPAPLPTLQELFNCQTAKENRPLFATLGQGVALIPLFRLPRNRGGRRATRRMTQVALDRSGSASFPDEPGSPGPGREASRPAPCGAPTRHLGL